MTGRSPECSVATVLISARVVKHDRTRVFFGLVILMAELKIDVPLVPQVQGFSCWYASACMLAYYFEAGPRFGLPHMYAANRVIEFEADLAEFARNEGLEKLESANHEFTPTTLIKNLSYWGPIFAGSNWKGYGHAVVITGCSSEGEGGGTVYYNDPEPVGVGAKNETVSLENFNYYRIRGCLLVRKK
ncbi:papain like cysteine protease AvrRpt2 [Marivita geojedonensis]|nr:papain like cysteine protease AvrRpt2 [Marivita geojedonensis]